MKFKITLIIVIGFINLIAAQTKVYLNNEYNSVPKNTATIYAIRTTDDNLDLIKIERYYISNDSLESKGYVDAVGKKTGSWRWFYDNGTIHHTATYSEGRKVGLQNVYSRNGDLKLSFAYSKERKSEMPYDYTYFKNHSSEIIIKDGNGFYAGRYKGELSTQIDSIAGPVVNHKAHGKWIGYKNGIKLFEEVYENGTLVNGNSFMKGFSQTYNQFYSKASPLIGLKKFREKLKMNVRFYFENFNPNKYQGKEKLKLIFLVTTNGEIEQIQVLDGLGEGPDEAVIRGLREVKSKWNPAKLRNFPIVSRFGIPYTFEM